jgi:hypothetical protein
MGRPVALMMDMINAYGLAVGTFEGKRRFRKT